MSLGAVVLIAAQAVSPGVPAVAEPAVVEPAVVEPAVVEPGVAEPAPPVEESPPPANLVIPLAHATALMTVMRVTETFLWPEPFARTEHFAAHYEEAYTRPPIFDASRRAFEWDGDPWYINGLGHAAFGSELYLRARMCRLPWYGALAFAAGGSTVWEYVFEANGVRPSAFDLVYTPLSGLVLGEARYLTYQAAKNIRSPALRGVVRAVVDPLGETERAFGTSC